MDILLAEDEKQLSHVLTVAMQSVHYHVDPVYNGQQAVEKAQENAYDVIILDIMMPVLDGISALKQIRQSGNRTYVIMLTAMAEVDDKVTGLDAGADDYMTKPFSLKELLARLRSLDRRQSNADQDLSFNDITLNQDDQQLVSHNSISLSARETKLLSFFILNANKQLPLDELLSHVWDNDDADSEDVWIYISYLRQKLQSVNAHVKISGKKSGPFMLTSEG